MSMKEGDPLELNKKTIRNILLVIAAAVLMWWLVNHFPTLTNFFTSVVHILSPVLVGLVLGYAAAEYSVGWSMALHIFNNLVLADLLSRLTASLPEMAVSAVNLTVFGGFFAAAVVILIANRARVRAYIQSEWIDRRCLKCFFLSAGVIVLTVLMVINMVIALSA